MAGIYVHIPFCTKACYYCDFHFSTNTSKIEAMSQAICKEITLRKDYLPNKNLQSIYFGGGTPSLLSEKQLTSILQSIKKHFSLEPNAEITLEANPDDLSYEKLAMLKANGINRLSIGIQSFQEARLQWMNRSHSAKQALEVVKNARAAGFDQLSIDLIYGLPDKDHQPFLYDLEKAIKFDCDHISAYCLTIEPRTVFGHKKKEGKIVEMEEELAAKQFEILIEQLEKNGYEQYEISNFAKRGKYAIHNTAYWQQKPYLGIGPSAHSYNKVSRQFNVANNHKYLKALAANQLLFESELLTNEQQINEYIMTSLRTMWGYNHKKALKNYEFDLLSERKNEIDKLLKFGLIELNLPKIRLTKKGRLQADWVAGELFL